jgi:hypothetical protein
MHRWTAALEELPWLFKRGRGLKRVDKWRILDIFEEPVFPMTFLAFFLGFLLPAAP